MAYIDQLDAHAYTLLVIDDQPTNLNVVVDYLDEIGFRILTARNGTSGLRRAKQGQPDLILLDALMPGVDGFETCRQLKADKETTHIPVIFMTALSDTTHKVAAFKVGAVDYIIKPIQYEEMLARITTHLQLRTLALHLEEAVVERTVELTRTNQNLEAVLYALSHDLKEPLRTIQTYTEFIGQSYAPQFDAKGRGYQQRIIGAAQRMQQMLDCVFMLSEVRQVKRPLQDVSGRAIVTAVLDNLQNEIAATQANVFTTDTYPTLQVDMVWAVQALYQLVQNALKYVKEPTRPPEIQIDAYQGAKEAGFVVRDRGPGISTDKIERNFQLFRRSVGRDIAGVGGGLAIARQIAEQYGGSVWAEPRDGGGMNFIITFGMKRSDGEEVVL